MPDFSLSGHGAPPIRGWLLLLCLCLIVAGPLDAAASLARALPAIPVRGLPLAALMIAKLVVAGVGVAAGIAMLTRREFAIRLARISLGLSASTALFSNFTPYFPSNRPPGDEWIVATASVVWAGIWLAYLARSKRVRETFR